MGRDRKPFGKGLGEVRRGVEGQGEVAGTGRGVEGQGAVGKGREEC